MNKNTYIEGLKKLSKIFFIGILIIALGFFVIVNIIGYTTNIPTTIISISVISYFTLIPIMCFYIFHLAAQKGADIGTYISYAASIFTFSLVSALCMMPRLINILKYDTSIGISYFIGLVSVYILVIAVILLSFALTDILILNVIISATIIFLPQYLITYVGDIVYEFCYYLNDSQRSPLTQSSYNLFTHNVFLRNGEFDSIPAIIYTLTLAAIYISITILIHKTKSKRTYIYATENRVFETLLRCIIPFFICLKPLKSIIYSIYYRDTEYLSIGKVALIYLFAILVYYLYEVLPTTSNKTNKKLLPGIPIILSINIIIVLITFGVCNYSASFTPNFEEIDACIIQNSSSDFYESLYNNIKITDETVKKHISEALKHTVDKKKPYEYENYETGPCGMIIRTGEEEENPYSSLNVIIYTNNSKYYRTIEIDTNILTEIYAIIEKNNDFIKKASILPISSKTNDIYFYTGLTDINNIHASTIYDIYVEELSEMDIEQQYEIIEINNKVNDIYNKFTSLDFWEEYEDKCILRISMSNLNGNKHNTCYHTIHITQATPRAYEKYTELKKMSQSS